MEYFFAKEGCKRMKIVGKCILCEGKEFLEMPYYYVYLGHTIKMIKCRKCGLATLNPMLSEREVRALYTTDYFEKDFRCGFSEPYKDAALRIKDEFLCHQLREIKQLVPRGKVLEIGCAGGGVLLAFKESGYQACGVEVNQDIAKWGKNNLKVNILVGTLHEQDFPSSFFDVVYTGDLIEHIRDPIAFLRKVNFILKNKGIVAIDLPFEINSLFARFCQKLGIVRKKPYKPYHLYSYVPGTLRALLKTCGFQMLLLKQGKVFRKHSWMGIIDLPNYLLTRVINDFGDRGFVIAQKKG